MPTDLPNPYSPPSSDQTEEFRIAQERFGTTRRKRLSAAIVDGILMLAVLFTVLYALGFLNEDGRDESFVENLLITLLAQVVYAGLNLYLLITRGQTIGKLIYSIQVVDVESDKLLPVSRVYLVRQLWLLPLLVLTDIIPGESDDSFCMLIGTIDVLFIFGAARRCFHDYLAKSKVVAYQPDRERCTS